MKLTLTMLLAVGIVNTSVANLFSKADYESSLQTQELMGATLTILEQDGMWMKVECSQPYSGWVPALSVVSMDIDGLSQWTAAAKYIVTVPNETVYGKNNGKSDVICDLVAGDLLKQVQNKGKAVVRSGFAAVELPDGKQGWVNAGSLEDYDKWTGQNKKLTPEKKVEKAIAWAEKMKGIPYMWGGISTKGFDCSGLVLFCYRMAGVKVPRDASQQYKAGKDVKFHKYPDGTYNLTKLKRGDLVFFGNFLRITHVGIYLGDEKFIQSSHLVRVNSLNKNDGDCYENTDKIVKVCRIVE